MQNASERYTEIENRQDIIEHAQPDLLLDIRHLTQVFPLTKKLAVRAVDDVSFQIRRGEIRIRKVNGCAVCDEYLSSGRREDRVSWD